MKDQKQDPKPSDADKRAEANRREKDHSNKTFAGSGTQKKG